MKLTTAQVNDLFINAEAYVPVGSLWLHYKGGVYCVVGHGFGTDIADMLVHYRRVGGPDFNAIDEARIVYDRPLNEWVGIGAVLMANTRRFTRLDHFGN